MPLPNTQRFKNRAKYNTPEWFHFYGQNGPTMRQQTDQYALDTIGQFLNYETPDAVKQQQLGTLNQQLANQYAQMNQQFNENMASRTGGRLGSTQRGTEEIGGQMALAGQLGMAEILKNLHNQELRTKLAGLQAYIQKYGIDKNAQLAMKQLKAQQDAALWGGIGGLLGTGLTAVSPWLGAAWLAGRSNG